MAHQVEPMDVDDIENDFDNKENTFHHSNLLPRTPCTEKGYEELDVSELNMKLRYSITPAASPMSKSMSHCNDNRYNASTDESLNNTVINENNLTRSLHSALNKTDSKSHKILPLQSLPADVMIDSSRNTTILQPLATTIDNKDITITVSSENEVDDLSIPSSSSSMAHTPEATTPTKEIPKDGGSPIMRGLKSVLSMFRSSQSPIPPADGENKNVDVVLCPTDAQLADSKPQAIASTPINQRIKDRSLSRRNSPHKESLVFNEDLEKELQWNDDSTIVFSTEKIPIHKLFFQDKPTNSKSGNLQQPVTEDVNSSVEYMDISYNDVSMRERTLNATGNKSTVTDVPESDGEFVDCETTITQDDCQALTEEAKEVNLKKDNDKQEKSTDKGLHDNNAAVIEMPFLDTTADILKLIDGSQVDINADETVKQLDFSTTDIVNQLSDLINASETSGDNVSLDKHQVSSSITESPKINDVLEQTNTEVLPKMLDNIVAHPENNVLCETVIPVNNAENVSIVNDELENVVGNLPNVVSDTLNVESVLPVVTSNASEINSTITYETTTNNNDCEIVNTVEKSVDEINDGISIHPSPCDIPLPNDDFNDVTDNLALETIHNEMLSNNLASSEMTQSTILATLNNTIELTPEIIQDHTHTEIEIKYTDIPCQPSIMPSDVPLTDIDDNNLSKKYTLSHEAATAVLDPVQPDDQTTDVGTAIDNTDSVNNAQAISPTDNADSKVTKSILPEVFIATDEPKEEEMMEVSFCEPLVEASTQKLSHNDTVTAASTAEYQNIAEPSNKPEQVNIENVLSESQFLDVKSQEANILPESIVTAEIQIRSDVSQSVPDITPEIDAIVKKPEIAPVVANLEISENFEALLNPNVVDTIPESVIDTPPAQDTPLNLNVTVTTSPDAKIDELQTNTSENINYMDTTYTSEAVEIRTSSINTSNSDISKLPNTNNVSPLVENNEVRVTEDVITEPQRNSLTTQKTEAGIAVEAVDENVLQPEAKVDEEIVASESNSPFVSISAEEDIGVQVENENLEQIEDPVSNKSPSPPMSPKIVSKGYNLNFDDLDAMNPFATKSKIRMSPPPGASPNSTLEYVANKQAERSEPLIKGKTDNRRKSMPERKKPLKAKRNFNSTFDSTESPIPKPISTESHTNKDPSKNDADIKPDDSLTSDKALTNDVFPYTTEVATESSHLDKTFQVEQTEDDSHINTTIKIETLDKISDETTKIIEDVMNESCKSPVKSENTSSSEQSTYFSAATSSNECIESKNVFNLPEIDDKNFNPFATKSKICQTPDLDMENPFVTKCKIKSSPETSFVVTPNEANTTVTIDTKNEFKDDHNLSNCSDSSRNSDDNDVTVQEVHTEDEDTIEGPFLEADDGIEADEFPKIHHAKDNHLKAVANEDETEPAEMFIDAEAFEFLMNQNNTDEVAYSGKESLFLKFDPLFARKATAEGVAAALNEIKKRQSTSKNMANSTPPRAEELMSFDNSGAGPSNLNTTQTVQSEGDDIQDGLNVTVLSKPMMAVPPAVNPVTTPKKSSTPTRSNRLSMTFTSPAMAVIDRLLSFNSPSAGADADQNLTQLRELLAEKEINVYNLRCESKELQNRLSTLEGQMKSLEAVSAERLQKINELTENLAEKTKMNRSMAAVVEEYERTIASLISETEQDKKRFAEERMQLIRDRDEQTAHLTSMEVSFNDLHSKYEKSKQVILGYKANEEAYKNSIKEFEDNLSKMHSNYELLKQHATSKLNHANQELEKLNKAHEAEVLKYNAMIKRKDLHITSLEESLAQKTKANEELTAICDELINKVG